MSLKIYSKVYPKGFKSVALANALRNLGKLPHQLGKVGSAITGEIKRNLSGRILNRRSGRLQDSWKWDIKSHGPRWRLIISSDVPYARIHNFGGFTGKGHQTKIRKTRYVDRAVIAKKTQVRRILRDYISTIWRG